MAPIATMLAAGALVVGGLSSCSGDNDDSPQDPDEVEQDVEQELDEVEQELDEVEQEIREETP